MFLGNVCEILPDYTASRIKKPVLVNGVGAYGLGSLNPRSGTVMCWRVWGLTTNSMEMSPSWEAASRSATQELSNILWNPKAHYRAHKSSLLVPILSQIDQVHTTPSSLSLRSILILSTDLRVPNCLLLLTVPPKSHMHSFSPHSCYMPCLSHPRILRIKTYSYNFLISWATVSFPRRTLFRGVS
jgi:hypothetical protein